MAVATAPQTEQEGLEQYLNEREWNYNGESYGGWVERLSAYHPDRNASESAKTLWAEHQLRAARASMPDPRADDYAVKDAESLREDEQQQLILDYRAWRRVVLA